MGLTCGGADRVGVEVSSIQWLPALPSPLPVPANPVVAVPPAYPKPAPVHKRTMAFATSLAPWAKDMVQAVNTWMYLQ